MRDIARWRLAASGQGLEFSALVIGEIDQPAFADPGALGFLSANYPAVIQ